MDALPAPTFLLPDWLNPQASLPTRRHRTKEAIDLERTRFEMLFDILLEEVARGRFLSSALREHSIDLDYGRFLAWLRADDERWTKYKDAQQTGGEMILARTMDPEIAAERTIPEDPHTAQLNFNKAKWYLAIVDRKRFGPSTQVSGDADQPIEHRVVHSIARSPLDELPALIEGSADRVDDNG